MHFSPDIVSRSNKSSIHQPVSLRSIKDAKEPISFLPERVPLSQNENALTMGQYLQKHPKAILTGKTPEAYKVLGYSTDIYPTMRNYAQKGYGYMEKSATTRITGTNTYGKSYNKLKDYFKYKGSDYVHFKDMTPEQVAKWNKEQADTYGMHIDPESRTSEQWIFITGKKPNTSNFPKITNIQKINRTYQRILYENL